MNFSSQRLTYVVAPIPLTYITGWISTTRCVLEGEFPINYKQEEFLQEHPSFKGCVVDMKLTFLIGETLNNWVFEQ